MEKNDKGRGGEAKGERGGSVDGGGGGDRKRDVIKVEQSRKGGGHWGRGGMRLRGEGTRGEVQEGEEGGCGGREGACVGQGGRKRGKGAEEEAQEGDGNDKREEGEGGGGGAPREGMQRRKGEGGEEGEHW